MYLSIFQIPPSAHEFLKIFPTLNSDADTQQGIFWPQRYLSSRHRQNNWKIPAVYAPALHKQRAKQDIVRAKKIENYPNGLGVDELTKVPSDGQGPLLLTLTRTRNQTRKLLLQGSAANVIGNSRAAGSRHIDVNTITSSSLTIWEHIPNFCREPRLKIQDPTLPLSKRGKFGPWVNCAEWSASDVVNPVLASPCLRHPTYILNFYQPPIHVAVKVRVSTTTIAPFVPNYSRPLISSAKVAAKSVRAYPSKSNSKCKQGKFKKRQEDGQWGESRERKCGGGGDGGGASDTRGSGGGGSSRRNPSAFKCASYTKAKDSPASMDTTSWPHLRRKLMACEGGNR
ncbi:hypothetical protein DFH07DRAFT_769283 [Mycena maculata]|uniref:Uncharacterized protein n=1 Tax=Mycena maculata TaxID=230809 RepID=A0AAD7JRK2_9AGAR|nr:hypothetical protein DFH07DRAFT_769283 [Mycena maculata]